MKNKLFAKELRIFISLISKLAFYGIVGNGLLIFAIRLELARRSPYDISSAFILSLWICGIVCNFWMCSMITADAKKEVMKVEETRFKEQIQEIIDGKRFGDRK